MTKKKTSTVTKASSCTMGPGLTSTPSVLNIVTPFEQVRQFHRKFGLYFGAAPRELTVHEHKARINHLYEELYEYEKAVAEGDLEGQFDALIDLVYVALGTADFHNFPFDEGFAAVHEANMKKVRAKSAAESKRNTKLDIVKPKGWKPANLAKLLLLNFAMKQRG